MLFLLRLYARNADVEKAQYALENTIKFLKELESYVMYDYELPKMYSAAVPDFGAGESQFKQNFCRFFNKFLFDCSRSNGKLGKKIRSLI